MNELPVSGPRFASVMVGVDLGIGSETRAANAAAMATCLSPLLVGVAAASPLFTGDVALEEEADRIAIGAPRVDGLLGAPGKRGGSARPVDLAIFLGLANGPN